MNFGPGPIGDGFQSPFGSLVGKIGTTYQKLGTHEMINVASGETLQLFYWDLEFPLMGPTDNTGSVKVTVATDSIQCTDNGTPIAAQGELRGERKVHVVGFPKLEVDDDKFHLPFPITVVACSQGEEAIQFLKNGSPIVPDNVLVNGMLVDVKRFFVLNTVVPGFLNNVPKSCDPGKKLADLNLLLDRRDFIEAILSTSGGTCTDGPVNYTITFHDGNTDQGFFGGQATVKLDDCDEL
jgi:hypothetical protein